MYSSNDLLKNYPFLQAIQKQTEWLEKLVPPEIKAIQARQKSYPHNVKALYYNLFKQSLNLTKTGKNNVCSQN